MYTLLYCFFPLLYVNEYYQKLINWDDPDDPIRRIIIPDKAELENWGELDASNEEKYTVTHGLEHKYEHTAVLLVSDTCGGYCRFCFRKRKLNYENDFIIDEFMKISGNIPLPIMRKYSRNTTGSRDT